MIPGASTDNTKANDTIVPKKRRMDSDGDNDETSNIEKKKVSTVAPISRASLIRAICRQLERY